jgi:hypothetical protein
MEASEKCPYRLTIRASVPALQQDLRQQGYSYRRIADFLNDTAIPGKAGGQWGQQTVSNILNRSL